MLSFKYLTALCLAAFSISVFAAEEDAAAAQPAAAAQASAPAPVPDENGFYEGAKAYVSDANRIWTRSGPGSQYRITGAKRIGEEMTFLSYSQDRKYARLQDSDGKIFWMQLDTIQSEKCGYLLEAELKAEIEVLSSKLANYDNELSRQLKTATARLERLERENAGMSEAIEQKDATIARLDELRRDYADKLETKELDMQMRWWLQGAAIAFSGAIAGIIFIYIPRPNRRPKRDRY